MERNGKTLKPSSPIDVDAEAMEYRLEGLQVDTNYTVTFRLHNKAGADAQSIQIRTIRICSGL